MNTTAALPDNVFVYVPESYTPGIQTGKVETTVGVGNIVWPGQTVGQLAQDIGACLTPKEICYLDIYEARVEEVLAGTQVDEPVLRLKPLRSVAELITAEVGGSWHATIENYWDKLTAGENIFLEPGQVVGQIRSLDTPSDHTPVIYIGRGRVKLLHVFHGDCGFVDEGDPLLLYQIAEPVSEPPVPSSPGRTKQVAVAQQLQLDLRTRR